MNFKKSKYYIDFFDAITQSYLLYNFYTQSLISTSMEKNQQISLIFNDPDNYKDTKLFETLLKEGFVLPVEENETMLLQNKIKDSSINSPLRITIAPTLSCNFSCWYCYQNKKKSFLSMQQADAIIEFINDSHRKKVEIKWIGGEPLLNIDIIRHISNNIKKPYSSTIYTNGYYLNEIIEEMNLLQMNRIYLTIDGTPERHNLIRYSKDDKNTFEKITRNIKAIIEKHPQIQTVIKTNIDDAKFDINKYLSIYKNFKGKVRLTFGSVINKDLIQNRSSEIKETSINYNQLYYNLLLDNRFAVIKLPSIKLYGCEAYSPDSIAFSSDGTIHKCIEGIGTKNLIIGKIDEGKIIFDSNKYSYIKSFNIFDNRKCINCRIFPHCMGGCLQDQLNSQKHYQNKCYDNKIESLKSMISNYWQRQRHQL